MLADIVQQIEQGRSVEPLPMTLIIFWWLMIQPTNPNQIKHLINGYHQMQIIGLHMANVGGV
jgi:hypothetical protein